MSTLAKAFDTLFLGRAAHLAWHEALASSPPQGLPVSAGGRGEGTPAGAAHAYLSAAIDGLRAAGRLQHIPSGLLARAAFRRDCKDLTGAEADLIEAHRIASRGGMRLHLADCYLEWGRLVLAHDGALANPDNRRHLYSCTMAARDLIEATGYHRRDAALAALRAALGTA